MMLHLATKSAELQQTLQEILEWKTHTHDSMKQALTNSSELLTQGQQLTHHERRVADMEDEIHKLKRKVRELTSMIKDCPHER